MKKQWLQQTTGRVGTIANLHQQGYICCYMLVMCDFMKKALIFIIAIVNITICNGQSFRPEIDSLIYKIASINTLSSNWVGIFLKQSDQRETYFTLKENATDAELVLLTKHENPNVRCYAFEALTYRKTVDLIPILIDHLYDTAFVNNIIGCMTVQKKVGDYFIEMVTSEYTDKHAYKLTKKEKYKIDSILILDKNVNLEAKYELLQSLTPSKIYYERIREIVLIEKKQEGLVALSKYKNQQDIELIIDKLKSSNKEIQFYGLWAVRNYPDSSFFRYLKEINSNELKNSYYEPRIRMFYQALVQYKDSASREIIELNLNESKNILLKIHSEYIWLAIEKYPAKIYLDIQNRIKLSDNERMDLKYWLENQDR